MNLIISADDFGMRPGIDNAIVELADAGLVTSVSVLVRFPNAPFALDYIKNHPQTGAGLHLDLDDLFCCADFGTDPSGRFLVPDIFFEEERVLKEICTQIHSQLDAFSACGRVPDHIDGHHHVHLFPPILDILLQEMGQRGIQAIRFDREFYTLTSDAAVVRDLLREHGVVFPEKFIAGPTLPNLNGARSSEIMVHVSQDVPEEECWRIKEMRAMLSEPFRSQLQNGGYQRITFQDLVANP